MRLLVFILLSMFLVFPLAARADFTFGPYTIPTGGSVDVVTQVEGVTWNTSDYGYLDGIDYHVRCSCSFSDVFASTFDDVLLLGAVDVPTEMMFEAHFTDNVLVNGPGIDLILLDSAMAGLNGYDVAIENATGFTDFRSYPSNLAVDVDRAAAYWWFKPVAENSLVLEWFSPHAIPIDLSDFGFAEGYTVASFRFRGHAGADPLGAAALHSAAPLPTRSVTWGSVKALYRN